MNSAQNKSDLTIVIPAYSEGESLRHTYNEIKNVFQDAGIVPQFILVDDGSSDNTPQEMDSIKQADAPNVKVIKHTENKGLGVAIKTGFLAAETEWVGWMPADGQVGPRSLLDLYRKREGYQVVTGKVPAVARLKADNWFRLILSRGSRLVMKAMHPHMPNFNGIIILHKPSLDLSSLICKTGFVNMEILDRLRRKVGKMRRFEEEIEFRPRHAGHSKVTNLRNIYSTISELAKLRFAYFMRR